MFKERSINVEINSFLKNDLATEFPLWLSRLRTQHSVREDAGSIPSLDQSYKDLLLSQAVLYVIDEAQF